MRLLQGSLAAEDTFKVRFESIMIVYHFDVERILKSNIATVGGHP
jgi:hypothetical protein